MIYNKILILLSFNRIKKNENTDIYAGVFFILVSELLIGIDMWLG